MRAAPCSCQYAFVPKMFVMTKVNSASVTVTAMLPVIFAEPGMSPKRFVRKMKKNTVSRYGV